MNHSSIQMLMTFPVFLTPHKQKRRFFELCDVVPQLQRSLDQVQQRGGPVVTLNKAVIPSLTQNDLNGQPLLCL